MSNVQNEFVWRQSRKTNRESEAFIDYVTSEKVKRDLL